MITFCIACSPYKRNGGLPQTGGVGGKAHPPILGHTQSNEGTPSAKGSFRFIYIFLQHQHTYQGPKRNLVIYGGYIFSLFWIILQTFFSSGFVFFSLFLWPFNGLRILLNNVSQIFSPSVFFKILLVIQFSNCCAAYSFNRFFQHGGVCWGSSWMILNKHINVNLKPANSNKWKSAGNYFHCMSRPSTPNSGFIIQSISTRFFMLWFRDLYRQGGLKVHNGAQVLMT